MWMGCCFLVAAGVVLQGYSEFRQGLIRGIKKVPAVLWGQTGTFLWFADANGILELFSFGRVDVVDGGGGGALLQVAEAAEAEEGHDADDAVGQDAKTEEDAEECAGVLRLAQGQEAEHDAAHAKYHHQPPAVVAAPTVVDRKDGKGDALEYHPHGEDHDERQFGGKNIGGQHQADDYLEHGQQGGGAGIGQEGLCSKSEDERRETGHKDDHS